MMRRTLLAGACAALFWAASVQAAPAAPPSDAARVAAAERLLDAMHFDTQIDRTMDAVITEVQKNIETSLTAKLDEPAPELIKELREIAADHMRTTMRSHLANLRRGTALIYARHFTVAELERLTTLQSDPALVKMQSELPQIAAESMALSRAVAESGQADLQARIKDAVERYVAAKGGKPVT